MNIEVRLSGQKLQEHSRVANRIADAVKAQDDMVLLPSSGPSLADLKVTDQPGSVPFDSSAESSPRILVEVTESNVRIAEDLGGRQTWDVNEHVIFTALTSDSIRHRSGGLLVPSADSLSLARLVAVVRPLSPIKRLYSTVVRRAADAADDAASSLDALQPIFEETSLEEELTSALAEHVSICQIRRLIASYTHSHLHMVKLDLVDSIDREALVDSLHADSRILVGTANDGFVSTADIQEFFRDHGRNGGDRWESFVWEESILVDDKCVYLMQDISPDAVSVPEIIDAIRVIAMPQLSLAPIRQSTDQQLGLLPSFQIPNGVTK